MAPTEKKTIYVLYSRLNMSHRTKISKFVLDSGAIPSYPAIVEDFYTHVPSPAEGTERDRRDAMVRRADQVWVFGSVSSQLADEIKLARRLGKQIRYFDGMPGEISEIKESQVRFERDPKRR